LLCLENANATAARVAQYLPQVAKSKWRRNQAFQTQNVDLPIVHHIKFCEQNEIIKYKNKKVTLTRLTLALTMKNGVP
jgi:hypothetical protein